MKSLQIPFVALASLLLGPAIWSCDQDRTPPEPADTYSAQAQPAPAAMPSAEDGTMEQLRADCPMVVAGADVTAADTEGGVALTFTTASGDVADLRTRVQHMGEMYGMHKGKAGMMWHHMGGEGMGGEGMGHNDHGMGSEGHMAGRGPMPAASTTTTDTDMGARLELRPTDPVQLEALREHVRWHQERLHSGECWMLQDQPADTSDEEQD